MAEIECLLDSKILPANSGRHRPAFKVYYSGDTNLFDGMDDVARVHSPDIAILNISGHLHGEDAVEAARRIGATTVIPSHFGAYGHLFLPEPKMPRDYDELLEGLGETVMLLYLGESLSLDAPAATRIMLARRAGTLDGPAGSWRRT